VNDKHNCGSAAHAALMDQVYRRQRHIYDISRKYFLFGRDSLIERLHAKPGESIVEIGCGTGRNLIRIAHAYPGTRLYGLDASEQMLMTARESTARYRERIQLRQGLAEELDPSAFGEPSGFDHAIFSYSLSMIPDWRGALNAAAKSIRPTGRVHIVDFGDLKGLRRLPEKMLRAWLARFHVAPRDELLATVQIPARNDCTLHILPFRFAFVLEATPQAIREIARGRGIAHSAP
jgi:S-adenosylmethionine-diacylgycerolhomoserine-N-methlytransferase